ncbi:cell division protein ZipA [Ferrimonas senticii]|uniref:cell division protein ZipA n=1 Tax=Ferrimonas senticii TaxID=394566 RepID=UPI0003FC4944|nr:cell division protein ZipA [Ferrimonas senticii]
MDDMRIVFLVVGSIAITALMIHGFYTVQKNKPKPQNRRTPPAKGKRSDAKPVQQPTVKATANRSHEPSINLSDDTLDEPSKPVQASLLSEEQAPVPEQQPEQVVVRAAVRQEPKLVEAVPEEQIELELPPAPTADIAATEPVTEDALAAQVDEPQAAEEQQGDVLVLYVVGSEGEPIRGGELLPNLITMGFKFGDMDIFHRHQHSGGNGPVLYSLANMHQPGVFDLDSMEQLTTNGVVLFLQLPSSHDARVVFSTMLGNAQGLADMHGGHVLDDQGQPWTDAAYESYLQRIKQTECVSA